MGMSEPQSTPSGVLRKLHVELEVDPCSQTEIYPVQSWSLAVFLQTPGPMLDKTPGPMGANFSSSWGLTPAQGEHLLLPLPALDESRSPSCNYCPALKSAGGIVWSQILAEVDTILEKGSPPRQGPGPPSQRALLSTPTAVMQNSCLCNPHQGFPGSGSRERRRGWVPKSFGC